MNREAWLKFLRQNEKVFGSTLAKLRGRIPVARQPEDVDGTYKHQLRRALDDFAEDYERVMRGQLEKSARLELSGKSDRNIRYLEAAIAAGIGAGAVIRAGNPADGIPAKVAEAALAHHLPTGAWSVATPLLPESQLPSGFTLSGRIWDLRYEQDILTIVRQGLSNGLSPEQLARQLDGFVLQGRELTTTTPYGRSLNFDAMRLARTEVARAGREASIESLRSTPWVTGLEWANGSGNPCEQCALLAGTMFTDPGEVPADHPHGYCYLIEHVTPQDEWSKAIDNYMSGGEDTLGIGDWLGD